MLSAVTLLMFDTTELLVVRGFFLSQKFLIKLAAYSAACSTGSPSQANWERLTLDKNWN